VTNSGREEAAAESRGKRGREKEVGKMSGNKAVEEGQVTGKISPIKAESQSERQTSDLMAAELISEVENPSNVNAEKSREIIERVASILFNI
jgi:hypothetical protein